ncbi:hypothetical protein FOZ63_013216, partial [Perkinsus olseni]
IHRPIIIWNEGAQSGNIFDPIAHSEEIEKAVLGSFAGSSTTSALFALLFDRKVDYQSSTDSSIGTVSSSTARNCLGVYTLSMYLNGDDAEMKMLVKLVRSPDYEVETITATTEVFPNLLRDPRCSVPFCIIDVVHYEDAEECDEGDAALRQEPNVLYHIHVSRFESQCTVPLSDLLMKWWFNSAAPTNIAELCRSFGSFLAAFHRDYPQLNHGDMNPTN